MDLQSIPFNHSGIDPTFEIFYFKKEKVFSIVPTLYFGLFYLTLTFAYFVSLRTTGAAFDFSHPLSLIFPFPFSVQYRR